MRDGKIRRQTLQLQKERRESVLKAIPRMSWEQSVRMNDALASTHAPDLGHVIQEGDIWYVSIPSLQAFNPE